MSIIEIRNLSKTYEFTKKKPGFKNAVRGLFRSEKSFIQAVKNLTLDVSEGELVGFLGPNGAGKTTTIKMLTGILTPTSGEAKVLGYVPWKRQAALQKKFALVMGQKNQLWWDLPAMETFILNKEIYELSDRDFKRQLHELVELLNIGDILHQPVRKLSLGQRMKAELVAALLHQPKILFLDEPTIGLDVVSQNNIREFLKTYNREKKTTILLTSHYMEDIEALCERVAIMNNGELMYDGKLQGLRDRYIDSKLLIVTFTEDVQKNALQKFGIVKAYQKRQVTLEVPKKQAKIVAAKLLIDFPVDDILINETEIEEVIRKMFSSTRRP